ncbi:hypothetical protein [Paraburkholderia tropica]|uniref:hypothetical protein n=1 Tax=Paraburkholderia tropica TaxID=92647 RepID=UPI002AB68569|nr:hypothetical protein [Paraburkholderia tropica]
MTAVSRSFSGIYIQGERIAIGLQPVSDWREPGDPSVYLIINGRSPQWGGDWSRLTADQRLEFTPDELQFARTPAGADELRALHVEHAGLPGFRTGVTLELEPGMRAFIETELPRVDRVTQLAAALRNAVEPHLGRRPEPYSWTTLKPHEREALVNVAANAILDGRAPDDAVRYAVLLSRSEQTWAFSDAGDDPAYADLGAVLRQVNVQRVLSAARAGQANA